MPEIDKGIPGPTKVLYDHMYLYERADAAREGIHNPPHLIPVEHAFHRICAYRRFSKGIIAEASWLPKIFAQNWGNNGAKDVKIQLTFDQEPPIVQSQAVIQHTRQPPTIPINSLVGAFECNGRAEDVIKRVQEKV